MRFRKVPWSETVAARLSRAMRYPDDAKLIGQEVENGFAECWEIDDGTSYLVTRKECADLCVIAFEGIDVVKVAERCRYAARKAGLPFVRFHTQSLALIRLLGKLNPEPIEYVMRISSYGQQVKIINDGESNNDERSRYRHDNHRA